MPFIARVQSDRYLRAIVSPDKNQRSHDQRLALIAHELQHALEVIQHEDVVDAATMQAMFSKIGASVKGGYETAAANTYRLLSHPAAVRCEYGRIDGLESGNVLLVRRVRERNRFLPVHGQLEAI